MVVEGLAARIARMVRAKCSPPPSDRSSRSTEVMTTWDRPRLATASATFCGSPSSSASGMPVRTLQKAQARVQVSPMIMKVACFFSQHSPILGQLASSHTVWRPPARTIPAVFDHAAEPGALTRIQSGLRSTSVRGRFAFSGWRGRFRLSMTVTMQRFPAARPCRCEAAARFGTKPGA